MEIIVSVAGIVVAITCTVVGIVIIAADAGVVIIARSCPVMTVRTGDVAPVISMGKRMFPHVVVGVEGNRCYIIRRVANEIVMTIFDDKEIF